MERQCNEEFGEIGGRGLAVADAEDTRGGNLVG
jgi:hypothetical protein